MQSNILREVEKRIISAFLDFIVLFALNHNGECISGYDIIKYVYERFHFLPSSGTIYSHLYAMERTGLLRGVQENRRRVYYLTPKGLDVIREVERTNGNVQMLVARVFSSNCVSVVRRP